MMKRNHNNLFCCLYIALSFWLVSCGSDETNTTISISNDFGTTLYDVSTLFFNGDQEDVLDNLEYESLNSDFTNYGTLSNGEQIDFEVGPYTGVYISLRLVPNGNRWILEPVSIIQEQRNTFIINESTRGFEVFPPPTALSFNEFREKLYVQYPAEYINSIAVQNNSSVGNYFGVLQGSNFFVRLSGQNNDAVALTLHDYDVIDDVTVEISASGPRDLWESIYAFEARVTFIEADRIQLEIDYWYGQAAIPGIQSATSFNRSWNGTLTNVNR